MAYPTHYRAVTLGGNSYTIARSDGPSGNPQWQVTREPAEPDELIPFREHISFGYAGMGSSLTAAPWQYDYALDVDPGSVWDELWPGLYQGKVGLALDYPVVTLDDAVAASPAVGPVSPVNTGTNSSEGTGAWTNADQVLTSNNSDATVTLSNGVTSQFLTATNFNGGLAVPGSATVLGVYVLVEAAVNTGSCTLGARLIIDGAIQPAAGARTTLVESSTDGTYTLGGANDLWEESSITTTQTNATGTNFGVALYGVGTAAQQLQVDHVQMVVVYGTRHKLLYAGAGPVLTKLTYTLSGTTPAFSTIETKTFSHASFINSSGNGWFQIPWFGGGDTSNPTGKGGFGITDVHVLKGGNSPGEGHVLICFGASGSIRQIDSISGYTTDTYTNGANNAFATYITTALGGDNTATTIWKTLASEQQTEGAFCRLQASSLTTGTLDYTSAANWSPDDGAGSAYQVGDRVHGITGMTEFQRGLVVGKPEGVYQFDQNANSFAALSTAEFAHPLNGRGITVWNNTLVSPTSEDIADPNRADPYIGLSSLLANLSPVAGTPTALAGYGRTLYVAYFDGTDSYIVSMRRRGQEPVPQDMIIHPITKVASHQVMVMRVAADMNGTVFLFYDVPSNTANKFDIGYCVLDPSAARRYATSGTWYSQRSGSAEKKTFIERLTFYGVNCNANNYWTVQVAWDEAAAANFGSVSRINATGRQTLTPAYGTNDNGYQYQLKLASVLNANTATPPRLRAMTAGSSDNGGVIVEGQRQADMVDRFQVVIQLSNNQETGVGGDLTGTARTRWAALADLAGTRTTMVNELHWGDTTARNVFVQSVSYVAGPQEGRKEGERRAIVTGRLLTGTE